MYYCDFRYGAMAKILKGEKGQGRILIIRNTCLSCWNLIKEIPVVAGMRNGSAQARRDLHIVLKDIGSALISKQFPES